MEPTDSMLVTEIRAGSAPAFGELMRRHRRLAYRIAYGLTRNPDSAMELVQDTFLEVHERIAEWRGDGEVKNGIARIAAHEAMNCAWSARRRKIRELNPLATRIGEPPQHETLVRRESPMTRSIVPWRPCRRGSASPSSCATSRTCRRARSPPSSSAAKRPPATPSSAASESCGPFSRRPRRRFRERVHAVRIDARSRDRRRDPALGGRRAPRPLRDVRILREPPRNARRLGAARLRRR